MKLQKSFWMRVFEFFLFFLIGCPLAIQIVEGFFHIKNPVIEYLQIITLFFAMIFFTAFYILRYSSVLKRYKVFEKKQKVIIKKLKEEKDNIEKDYIDSIRLNKEMTNIVKRLIETERGLREKNEWLKNFFELSTKIISLSSGREIVEVIGEFKYESLRFVRASVYHAGDDKKFKSLYQFGQKDVHEQILFNKAKEDVNIAYKVESNSIIKVAIPIISEEKCEGICFYVIECKSVSNEDVGYYISMCNFITMAIKNAIYYSNLKKQKSEIEDLYEKSTYMNEKLKETIEELNKSKAELEKKNQEIEKFFYETILCLSKAIEYKDVYTKGHCERVQSIALKIADELSLSDEEKDVLKVACLLHDIGKIGVKEDILNKKGSLEAHEYEEIQKHPLIGYNILKDLEFTDRIKKVVLQHHERVDGRGYPFGLKDEEIDLLAKIVAVADAYDAMTSDRPYRKAFDKETALSEMKRCAGSQFDTTIVEKLINLAQKGLVMFL